MASSKDFAQLLDQLGSCLPAMAFTDQEDAFSTVDSHVQQYLAYYGIDFHRQDQGINFRIGALRLAGYRIACYYWQPSATVKGTVLIAHGYFDHIGLYGHLIRHLLDNNYAVAAFDLPGHGLSSGERAAIDSFSRYVEVLDGVVNQLVAVPQPLHAVGQSTGCAVLLQWLLTASSAAQPIDKVVLLAPLVKPKNWGGVNLLYRLLHRFCTSVPRGFVKTCDNPEFLTFIEQSDPLQSRRIPVSWVAAMKEWIERFPGLPALERPLYIVQGDNDQTVDWRYNNRAIQQKITGTSLTLIPKAGHHLVNENPSLRAEIFAAIPL